MPRFIQTILKHRTFFVPVVLVLVLVILLIAHSRSTSPGDCEKIRNQSEILITHRSYKKAYNNMKTHIDTCADVSSLTKNKNNYDKYQIQVMKYDYSYAKASFSVGASKEAYYYSNKALKIFNTALKPAQRAKVLSEPDLIAGILRIRGYSDPRWETSTKQ